jgi:DHA1 family bicyclomycin/chloramphenicol resistance-like MFS transporter
MPFPDRAGAASSLLGLCQMLGAAGVGLGVGHALAWSPLAMPLTIAGIGLMALGVFMATGTMRGARPA